MLTKASRMNWNLKASDRIYGYHVWCYNFFFLDSIIISCHYFIVIHYIGVISRNVKLFSTSFIFSCFHLFFYRNGIFSENFGATSHENERLRDCIYEVKSSFRQKNKCKQEEEKLFEKSFTFLVITPMQ